WRNGDYHKHSWDVNWQANPEDVRREAEAGRQINRDIEYYLSGSGRDPETGKQIAPVSLSEALGAEYRVRRDLLFQLVDAYFKAFQYQVTFEHSIAAPLKNTDVGRLPRQVMKSLKELTQPNKGTTIKAPPPTHEQVVERFTAVREEQQRLLNEMPERLLKT